MKYIVPVWVFLMMGLMTPLDGVTLAGEADLLQSGQKAFSDGKFIEAEQFFSQVVAQAPDDHKALRSLAETKIKLKKFQEAETLIDRILKMPVVKGRNVQVYVEGDPNPHEAELVDETVMVVDESAPEEKEQSQSFIRGDVQKRVPHYRVYFMKTGKMKLLPKSKTRIQYKGIPTATRDHALAMKAKVQKILISTQHGKVEEEMVDIPAGCFQMGSEQGDPDERPVHKVCISAFQMGKYEVQQKNFQAVMGANPSQHVGADLPVDSLTWDEATMGICCASRYHDAILLGGHPFRQGSQLLRQHLSTEHSGATRHRRIQIHRAGGFVPPQSVRPVRYGGQRQRMDSRLDGCRRKLLSGQPGTGSSRTPPGFAGLHERGMHRFPVHHQ